MWFLMFVVCFTTDCELRAYPKPFKTEAECQLSIAETPGARSASSDIEKFCFR